MTIGRVANTATAVLLGVGSSALAATPARAAEVDLSVDLRSTTAVGVTVIRAVITNNGTTAPGKMTLAFDTSGIDKSRAEVFGPATCTTTATSFQCAYEGQPGSIPKPGESREWTVAFWRPAGAAPGAIGDLRATVAVEGDAVPENNGRSIGVVTSPVREPQLRVSAPQVTRVEFDEPNGKPIPPGGKSTAYADITNFGAVTATAVRTVGTLPKGVRFITTGQDECQFSADARTATCVWDAEDDPSHMIPFIFDPELDKFASSYRVRMPVVVDRDVKGPVTLTGGEWQATPIGAEEPKLDDMARYAASSNAGRAGENGTGLRDRVEFSVLVGGKAAGGSGNGTGGETGGESGSETGGGADDDPTLPITGPVAATVAGTGAALVGIGAVLVLATRRRRVTAANE